MKNEGSVDIERPIEEVYDYTVNHIAEWSPTCLEEQVLEETPQGVGTTFRIVTENQGKRMVFAGVVKQQERPTRSTVFLEGKYFDIDVDYLFETIPAGTRVTQISEVHPKRFMFKTIFFLMGGMMKKASCDALDKEFASLKEKCEAQAS